MFKSLYDQSSRSATWLELFFDLVFVAAIGIISHDLAHTHHGHLNPEQLIRFVLVFIPMWWIWITHTIYANRFDTDNRGHKLFSLVLMGLVIFMATFARETSDKSFVPFVILYAGIRLYLSIPYWNIYLNYKQGADFTKHIALSIVVGGLISGSAVFFNSWVGYIIFISGIVVDIAWQTKLRDKTIQRPVDKRHLVERLGLLAIIILGESVISIVSGLSEVDWELYDILGAATGFIMVSAIWWIYFDSYHLLERAKRLTNSTILTFMHLFVCTGLFILANLIRHAILLDLDQKTFGMLAVAGMTFFYIGKEIPYVMAFPVWTKMIIINTVVCISITALSTLLPRIEYSLIGMTCGMLFYVFSTFKWRLSVPIEQFLEEETVET